MVADGGKAALGPNTFCGRDRGNAGHFSVQAVCWAGLEAFAPVSCLQSVVGKTSFVPGNVNQHNLLPMNKLLITNSGIEKNTYKDVGKIPLLPLSLSPIPLLQLHSVPSARQGVAWEIGVNVL